ncbi:PAS domain-containing sensor histidine kinase [Variovorax sp. dw_308]|uniref:PAS domain-containing sensor histidine kinase n=1 Tax=Variovorax sp. dw_308 TaxID=2721546 RepID=UPI001C44CA5D|nr:PAS domain-containing sensor histidine kinase [Variovorax sp. dw_308]
MKRRIHPKPDTRGAEGLADENASLREALRAAEHAAALHRGIEERFELAITSTGDGIFDWDMVTDLLYLSQSAQLLHGLQAGPSIRPRSDWQSLFKVHPDDALTPAKLVIDQLADRLSVYEREWRVLHDDGAYHWLRMRGRTVRDPAGRPIRLVGSICDIDPQKRAETALLKAQRLEVTGTMASGIAHDFNNILAAILGYGEMALRDAEAGSRLRHGIESILVAGERGRALVDRILVFSRSGVGERVPVHFEGVVQEVLELLAATLPADIHIESCLNAGCAAVMGDSTQLHQVVMNLGTNAIHAMAEGGTLRIALEVVDIAAPRITTTGRLNPGEYVALQVTDSGSGIAADKFHRIFDAFFTTRDDGVGTGLGLALVHGVIAEFGGSVHVESKIGAGSTFTVYLPRSGDAAPAAAVEAPASIVGCHEQILVVDDEPALMRLMVDSLSELGYVPVGFSSSIEALAAFRAYPHRFDAVITDERMPAMSGSMLIRELRSIRPAVPILLLSGYLGGNISHEAVAAGADELRKKPLSVRDLASVLARLLGPRPEASRR